MSDDEELLYGLLGTQFNTDADEQTEFKRSKLKRKAAEEEVVDAKGRATRFHGAFTGGFSAGYYNTVGSEKGFQPSEFVSQSKASVRNYRLTKPEDFMDDEDFDENGIAPRLLRTKSIFDNDDIRNHMKQTLGSHDIVGDSDILKDILIPQSVTIGLMLLRKLGYLASRGVGESQIFYSSEVNDNETSLSKKFDYESEETFQLIPKNDRFGLGYSGMNRDLISAKVSKENRSVNFGLKDKKGIRGVAFAGVDEEDDEEDIRDIYGLDSISKYNYEYIEDDKDEKDTNYGWTAPKYLRNAIMPSDSIPGFQMGTKCSKNSLINYEPLQPPRFYLPIFPIRKENDNNAMRGKPERAKLMPNYDQGSVLSLLSSEDRNRLLNISKTRPPKTRGSRWGDSNVASDEDKNDISANLTQIRKESNNCFITPKTPENPFKLEQKQDLRRSWGMVSSLSSKFKSAGSSTAVEDNDYYMKKEIKVTNDLELPPKELAANTDTYGFMTRSNLEWHPDKLLCKRFNVPDPYPGTKFVGVPDEINVPEVTERNFNEYHAKRSLEDVKHLDEVKPECFLTEVLKEDDLETASGVKINITVPDISDKPPIDLFKSVFDDSDAEFSSSEDEEVSTKVVAEVPKLAAPISILSSMEQALGAMFGDNTHNIINEPKSIQSLPTSKDNPRIFGPTPPPDFIYNPVLPSTASHSINDIISKNIPKRREPENSEPYVFIDKMKLKKKKHEKKSKKSKTQKKDKKKKKQKKKKSSSESESSD